MATRIARGSICILFRCLLRPCRAHRYGLVPVSLHIRDLFESLLL